MKNYRVVTWGERFDLYPEADEILCSAWPEFMLNNKPVNDKWEAFVEQFKDIQLMLMNENEILAIINTQTIRIDMPLQQLPDEGWEWGFLTALENKAAGIEPNYLLGFQVVVNPNHQGKGLAQTAVLEMQSLSKRLGLQGVLIALRPNLKAKFPLLSMEDYLRCKTPNGESYDPWIRIHERLGGELIRICPKAYSIEGTVKEWQQWTQQEFPCSGEYLVEGGLNPIQIDLDSDHGKYTEPNVWLIHRN